MGSPVELETLAAELRDLRRTVNQLATAPRLTNASLHRGTLTILDDDKDPLARLGVLPDGKVGLAVYDADGNEQVRFGQLAGGGYGAEMNLEVDVDNAYIARNVSDWGDGTSVVSGSGSAAGPSVSLLTGSRALVFLSARIQANDGAGAEVSYAISGATTSAAGDDLGRFAGLSFASAANGLVEASVGRVYLQTGLTPGTNTFAMKYRTNGSTEVLISHRTIAVLPL